MNYKYVKQVSLGLAFEDNEIKSVAKYFGLSISPLKLGFSIILLITYFILLPIMLGAFSIYSGSLFFSIVLTIIEVLLLFIVNFARYSKRLNAYYDAVDMLYKERLARYPDMQSYYTIHIPNPESKLKKSTVLFLTDGYYFVILEDFLIKTQYLLKGKYRSAYNRYPVFKIIDPNTNFNKIFNFKLSDIDYYSLIGQVHNEKQHKKIEEYYFVYEKDEYKNYLEIHFKDLKSIKVGTNIYKVLKDFIPYKEK